MARKSEFVDAICERCGIEWVYRIEYVRRENYDLKRCPDCRAEPRESIRKNGIICQPWHGEYDEDENPIKDGELYRPGPRLCGHKDCIRPTHIDAIIVGPGRNDYAKLNAVRLSA